MKDIQNIEKKLAGIDWTSQDEQELKKVYSIYDWYYAQYITSCKDSFTKNYVKDTFQEQLNLYLDQDIDTATFIRRITLIIRSANINLYGNNIVEGSSGTPVSALGTIPSKDRAELINLFNDLRDRIDPDKFTVIFNQDRIDIYIKTYSDVGFDYTPYQKVLGEDLERFDYTPFIGSLLEYMIEQGMNIQPLPEIKVRYDEEQAKNFFGKTAYYNPENKEIILYAAGRLPKDVVRSFAHEMIHHIQNLEGRLQGIRTSNTNEDSYLKEIEEQAYLEGNIIFRNWEDSLKN